MPSFLECELNIVPPSEIIKKSYSQVPLICQLRDLFDISENPFQVCRLTQTSDSDIATIISKKLLAEPPILP